MTSSQKDRIVQMRKKGRSYAAIAETLGVSENTVKSFCRRNNLGGSNTDGDRCAQCGKNMGLSDRKNRRFCNDSCRSKWWAAHPEKRGGLATVEIICAVCGKSFFALTGTNRKFCSRKCYGKSKAVAK
ncbi:MAG: helix-turn-helix domain-containing protein [Oscillospiraceae bacterium]|jgi:endogenous inhibitor of DNA gyrase (YacG/DUF329 family)|nr:helix-turn-helix domain-containing protein [Oscillospiraceae bacterium]